MFTVGSHGVYEWLVTDDNFDLLQLSPEIVLGKYVAITSIDSGQLMPTDKETAAGWLSRARIAYSPKIENAQDVPRAGYDEWYIFDAPTDLGTSYLGENIFEITPERGHLGVFVKTMASPCTRQKGQTNISSLCSGNKSTGFNQIPT